MILKKEQIIIPPEKILVYLLRPKERNDKSKFLLSLGYSQDNWHELLEDIKNIAIGNELVLERKSEFGDLYSIRGYLKQSTIITIWFQQVDYMYRFITLYTDYG